MKLNISIQICAALSVFLFAAYAEAQISPPDNVENEKIWQSLTAEKAPDCVGLPAIPDSIFHNDGNIGAVQVTFTHNLDANQAKINACVTEVQNVIAYQAEQDKASSTLVGRLQAATIKVLTSLSSTVQRNDPRANIQNEVVSIIGIRG